MSLGQSPEGCSSFLFPRFMGLARVGLSLEGNLSLYFPSPFFSPPSLLISLSPLYPSLPLSSTSLLTLSSFQANEMLLAGEKITAEELSQRGLVTRVFRQDEFHEKLQEIVKHIASLPPQVS